MRGHVFHIDFGKYLGDWQMAGGFRRFVSVIVFYLIIDFRDRVPFIFTSEMAYVINDGSQQSTTHAYQEFIDKCCEAFNLLRKRYSLIINLVKLVCSMQFLTFNH